MHIQVKIEIEPFNVPNGVYIIGESGKREDGLKLKRSLDLSELSAADVGILCDDFKTAVLAKRQAQIGAKIRAEDPT